jgi:chemotaxis protein methyltransferase WspC
MLQSSIERLIQQETGIDPTIIGSNLIRSAINRCMKGQGIKDLGEYWRLLQQQPQVRQQLIETIVVPETWFFRDRGPFEFIAHRFHQLRPHPPNNLQVQTPNPVRILSLPCSTGEEPYSIAMALLQAGILPTAFQIDAWDISQQHIQQAITGLYNNFSFRNASDIEIKQQFFQPIGESYQIHDRVKQCVHFQVGNILQISIPASSYDVIFCRNLLIYFDQSTRQTVIDRLSQLLKPSGTLFVGHAETSLFMNDRWQGIRVPFTFAYRKTSAQPQSHPKAPRTTQSTVPPQHHRPTAAYPPSNYRPSNHRPSNHRPSNHRLSNQPRPTIATDRPQLTPPIPGALNVQAVSCDLSCAQQAANQADFPTAKQLCAEALQRSPLQPGIYVLLGQIHQAQDQPSMAETCFSKALYLDPNDLDALIHLARLKQSRGDLAASERLHQRVARIESQHNCPSTDPSQQNRQTDRPASHPSI